MDYKSCRIIVTLEFVGNNGDIDITKEVNEAKNIDLLMEERGAVIKALLVKAFERAQEEIEKL